MHVPPGQSAGTTHNFASLDPPRQVKSSLYIWLHPCGFVIIGSQLFPTRDTGIPVLCTFMDTLGKGGFYLRRHRLLANTLIAYSAFDISKTWTSNAARSADA